MYILPKKINCRRKYPYIKYISLSLVSTGKEALLDFRKGPGRLAIILAHVVDVIREGVAKAKKGS